MHGTGRHAHFGRPFAAALPCRAQPMGAEIPGIGRDFLRIGPAAAVVFVRAISPTSWGLLLDRQTRTSAGARQGAAFRTGRRGLWRDTTDHVDQPEAARGNPRRRAGAARLALSGLYAGGRTHARL